MKFQPKTDWKYDDTPTEVDFNRIEQGIADALEGNDPIIQQDTPPDGVKEGRLWLDTSDDTYQGTVFESLKGEIDGHFWEKASTSKVGHVQLNSATNSEDETTAATPKAVKVAMDEAKKMLPLTGGSVTGNVEFNGEFLIKGTFPHVHFEDINEPVDQKKIRIILDNGVLGFHRYTDTLEYLETMFAILIKDKKITTYGNEILHTGNLASFGVGRTIKGSYVGDYTNDRFINVGATPKMIAIYEIQNNGPYGDYHSMLFMGIAFRAGWKTFNGTSLYHHDGEGNSKNGIDTNGFYVSGNDNNRPNGNGRRYEWIAFV